MSQYSKPSNCEGKVTPCEECDRCKMFIEVLRYNDPISWEEFKQDLEDNHLIREKKLKQEKERLDKRREFLGLTINTNKKHLWVTISLDPTKDVNVDEINAKFKYKYLKDAIYCYEFHGASMEFHPHIHMLVEAYTDGKIIPRTTIIRDFSRALKIETNFIDVKNEPWLYTKRRAYVLGNKKEEKLNQVCADAEYRLEKNIDEYYTI